MRNYALQLFSSFVYMCCASVQSQLLPIPDTLAAGSVDVQLQDYTLPGTATAPSGLLGFLCDAFSVLPQGTSFGLPNFVAESI